MDTITTELLYTLAISRSLCKDGDVLETYASFLSRTVNFDVLLGIYGFLTETGQSLSAPNPPGLVVSSCPGTRTALAKASPYCILP